MNLNTIKNFLHELSNIAHETLIIIGKLLNSNFSIALLGSMAGALAGALAAQRFMEKNKHRELFISEIRNTNAAIMVSFSICNFMLSLKKQHTLPLYQKFHADKKALEEFQLKRSAGQLKDGERFEHVADFKTISSPPMPVDTLQKILFNKISVNGRPLGAVSILEGSLEGLKESLHQREVIAEKFKTNEIPEADIFYYYFGLKMPSGNIHQEYPDLIDAIHSYNNDVIFFSSLICKDLIKHGEALRDKEKKLAKFSPKISTADFSTPEAKGLMPPDSDYSSWLGGIVDMKETS